MIKSYISAGELKTWMDVVHTNPVLLQLPIVRKAVRWPLASIYSEISSSIGTGWKEVTGEWWDKLPLPQGSIRPGLYEFKRTSRSVFNIAIRVESISPILQHDGGLRNGTGLSVAGPNDSALMLRYNDFESGIAQSLSSAVLAGERHAPLHVYTTKAGQEVVWTEREANEIVGELTENAIAHEAASGKAKKPIVDAIERLASDINYQFGSWDSVLNPLLPKFERDYRTYRAAYDPDALAPDLPTLKIQLAEWLESSATGHQKAIKGAFTQQAIDNWATCIDQDNALAEIAKQCTLGVIEIRKADNQSWVKAGAVWKKGNSLAKHTHEGEGDPKPTLGKATDTYVDTASGRKEALAAFEAAKAKIKAVNVLRVPVWKIGSTVHKQAWPKVAVTGRKLEVRAKQPTGKPTIPGGVAITGWGTKYADGSKGSANVRTIKDLQQPETHCAEVTIPDSETKPVIVEIVATNLCGPSTLTITMTPPPKP